MSDTFPLLLLQDFSHLIVLSRQGLGESFSTRHTPPASCTCYGPCFAFPLSFLLLPPFLSSLTIRRRRWIQLPSTFIQPPPSSKTPITFPPTFGWGGTLGLPRHVFINYSLNRILLRISGKSAHYLQFLSLSLTLCPLSLTHAHTLFPPPSSSLHSSLIFFSLRSDAAL